MGKSNVAIVGGFVLVVACVVVFLVWHHGSAKDAGAASSSMGIQQWLSRDAAHQITVSRSVKYPTGQYSTAWIVNTNKSALDFDVGGNHCFCLNSDPSGAALYGEKTTGIHAYAFRVTTGSGQYLSNILSGQPGLSAPGALIVPPNATQAPVPVWQSFRSYNAGQMVVSEIKPWRVLQTTISGKYRVTQFVGPRSNSVRLVIGEPMGPGYCAVHVNGVVTCSKIWTRRGYSASEAPNMSADVFDYESGTSYLTTDGRVFSETGKGGEYPFLVNNTTVDVTDGFLARMPPGFWRTDVTNVGDLAFVQGNKAIAVLRDNDDDTLVVDGPISFFMIATSRQDGPQIMVGDSGQGFQFIGNGTPQADM